MADLTEQFIKENADAYAARYKDKQVLQADLRLQTAAKLQQLRYKIEAFMQSDDCQHGCTDWLQDIDYCVLQVLTDNFNAALTEPFGSYSADLMYIFED